MRVIVSFTSYPPRIDTVYRVVESLYRQTVRADEIVLYLSIEEFPDAEESIPHSLRRCVGKGGFRIEWVKGNLKSHKKYYYALQQYRKDIVITVDDDVIYADTMISDLVDGCNRFPDAVSARNARMIIREGGELDTYGRWKKRLDQYSDMPRMDLCAIGAGGVCYPPLLAESRWFDEQEILGFAGEQDDLWLKYNEVMDGIPVVYIKPSHHDTRIENAQIISLRFGNLYHGENDKSIRGLVSLMQHKNQRVYNDWFQGLVTGKRYYQERFGNIIGGSEAGRVYLYGAGKVAESYMNVLDELQLTDMITAVVVTEKDGNPSEMHGVKVITFQEMDDSQKFGLILGVSDTNRTEIENLLKEYDYHAIPLDRQEIQYYRRGW